MEAAEARGGGQKGDTWPRMLLANYERYGDAVKAMRFKRYGIWQAYTWKDYYLDVKYLALGLAALGFKPGDVLLIIGNNAPQWLAAELAAQGMRGISAGIDPEASPSETARLAGCLDARFAVVEDQEQVDKLLEARDRFPLLEKIVYWRYKGLAHYKDSLIMGFREALSLGKEYESGHPRLFEESLAAGKADDICAIVYTSGTTGAPKAVAHSYRTMAAGAESWLRVHPWRADDSLVPRLSAASIMGQWSQLGCHLISACTLNFAEERETEERDAREISPTIAVNTARFWEEQAAGVQARVLEVDAFTRCMFNLLMPVAYRAADLGLQETKTGPAFKALYALCYLVLFRRIKERLGLGSIRLCYSMGGLLSPEARRFYHALGVPVRCLYYTTEGGLLPAVGDPFAPGVAVSAGQEAEARIGDGAILSRAPGVFAGYYKDAERTASAVRDGWFDSGDIGAADREGRLLFLDRADSLTVLATGDPLLPQLVESRLRSSPYIRDAWVFSGPERTHVCAVIVVNYNSVSRWAGQKKVAHSSMEELSQRPEVYGLVRAEIERVNCGMAACCHIRKFVNLHREFDPGQGELTRNGNLHRGLLSERYREIVTDICAGAGETAVEVPIRRQDGRVETRRLSLAISPVEGASG